MTDPTRYDIPSDLLQPRWLRSRYSPLDNPCTRWRQWLRWIALIPGLKYRLLPVVVNIRL